MFHNTGYANCKSLISLSVIFPNDYAMRWTHDGRRNARPSEVQIHQ